MNAAIASVVLAEAKSWIGTPYHHQARVKGRGVDCATLLAEVYARAGAIATIDLGNYPMQWHLHRGAERYLGWLMDLGDEVTEPQPADVVVYRYGRCFSHGGIVLEWPRIIHSFSGVGCVYADGLKGALAERPHRFFRVRTP